MKANHERATSFDVIVVGAGGAGAVFAAELAARTTASILLLEAGRIYWSEDTPPEMRSVATRFLPALRERFEWPNVVAGRTHAQRPAPYPIAKVGGGGSAINESLAIRGLSQDFDRWGCEDWTGARVLPTFMRIEADPDFGDRAYHGSRGPLPLVRMPRPEAWPAMERSFLEAAIQLGHGFAEDQDAFNATGVSPFTRCERDFKRVSTVDAFLEPARSLPNLTIVDDTLAVRVLFEGRRATGVAAVVSGTQVVFHSPEIYVCAGAFNSPALLLRSGIGPSGILKRLGMRTISDRAGVGRNLSEHPVLLVRASAKKESPGRIGVGKAFLRYSLRSDTFNDGYIVPVDATAFFVALLDPVSRGELLFRSVDPAEAPTARFEMLSDVWDAVRFRELVRHCMRLLGRMPEFGQDFYIGLGAQHVRSDIDDATLDRILLEQCMEFAHPAGTCRIGVPEDPFSVVGPDCAVHGVEGIYVVDASIFPALTRAAPALSCAMIGAHLAELRAGRGR